MSNRVPKKGCLGARPFSSREEDEKNPLVISSVAPSSQASRAAIDAVHGWISHLAGVGELQVLQL
jgi:hypothetical protein